MTRKKLVDQTVELGDLVKDKITGFEGVAICRNHWLNNCIRFAVQSTKLNKDGKADGYDTFDIEQLEVLKKAHIKIVKPPTGGPKDAPVRGHGNPVR